MLIRFCKRRIKKLRKLVLQPDVDLWALDEVHFQQYGSGCRMWVPPEVKEPVLLHAPTRKSVCYFGAVRLRDGKFISQPSHKESWLEQKKSGWHGSLTLSLDG